MVYIYINKSPAGDLQLVQRTLSAGLRAVYWRDMKENCGRSLTHVSSLHFLIHFVNPQVAYRPLHTKDLLCLCGFLC